MKKVVAIIEWWADCSRGDPAAIRTQDPRLRRALLYPAELRDLTSGEWRRRVILIKKLSPIVTRKVEAIGFTNVGLSGVAKGIVKCVAKDVAEGGERGIRTPGTLRYGGFQDRCNRPLYHLSRLCARWGCALCVVPRASHRECVPCVASRAVRKSGAKVQRFLFPASLPG